jgi:hypothetical protein
LAPALQRACRLCAITTLRNYRYKLNVDCDAVMRIASAA